MGNPKISNNSSSTFLQCSKPHKRRRRLKPKPNRLNRLNKHNKPSNSRILPFNLVNTPHSSARHPNLKVCMRPKVSPHNPSQDHLLTKEARLHNQILIKRRPLNHLSSSQRLLNSRSQLRTSPLNNFLRLSSLASSHNNHNRSPNRNSPSRSPSHNLNRNQANSQDSNKASNPIQWPRRKRSKPSNSSNKMRQC